MDPICTIQAAYRGYHARKHTTTPKELLPFLGDEWADEVCKEVNSFYIERQLGVKKMESYYLRWNKGELSLIFPGEKIFEEVNKRIDSAKTLHVERNKMKISDTIVMETLGNFEFMEERHGIHREIYAIWQREKPRGVYLMEPFEKLEEGVYTQPRLKCNLLQLYQTTGDQVQIAACLLDMTRTLAWMHRQNYIHGDVKLTNVLVAKGKDDEEKERHLAYLTDFDHTDEPGMPLERITDGYWAWDPAMCRGEILSPYVDYYGLIAAHLMIQFPDLEAQEIKQAREILECPFENLTDFQTKVWDLFFDICKESTRLFRHLENSAITLSAGQVMRAVDRVKTFDVERRCLELSEQFYRESQAI